MSKQVRSPNAYTRAAAATAVGKTEALSLKLALDGSGAGPEVAQLLDTLGLASIKAVLEVGLRACHPTN